MSSDSQNEIDEKFKSHLKRIGVNEDYIDYYERFYGSKYDKQMEEDLDSYIGYLINKER